MENRPTWNVEQVWGSDRFYHEGDVAEDMVAFVIDSGISLETNDLNINKEWSKSFTSNPDPFDDQSGHGTAVASVIAAKANYEGLTGVAPGAQVVALKVFDGGSTFRSRVENALQHAKTVILENDLVDRAVINLSLGGSSPNNHPSIAELAELGIKITVSAGNEWSDADGYSPASYGHLENVYTVSANDSRGRYSSFTNFDDDDGFDVVDYTAPGTAIPTYNTDGTIRNRNGTSFSAPHVAGLLLMSDIKAGQKFELTEYQKENGMVGDPLAMFDPTTYKHEHQCPPPPDPIIIEVPVPGPVVEVPVPGPVVEVPVPEPYPVPVDPITGEWNENNRIKGTSGDDFILGGAKNDRIKAGKGDDTIIAFGGRNKLRGGEGADEFIVNGKIDGVTKIFDYDPSEDTIVLMGDYELKHKNDWTKVYVEGDLIAKINGIHTEF